MTINLSQVAAETITERQLYMNPQYGLRWCKRGAHSFLQFFDNNRWIDIPVVIEEPK